MSKEHWVTLSEAATILRVSNPTLYRYVKRSGIEIRTHKIDRRLRYIDINALQKIVTK